ncbi:MAG: hypothetical protein KDJ22_10525 [Candidatus Competibacteraceae bacterium]|nr:hypothetical protein [Candidatus Competibacteraceae bacterium]MCP5127198.1 hypothetical protein [Gammaproteobacteria bacterium]HRX71876.1 hypothetical protein [Candidatus Competibacteraceae bacterium]
MQAFDQERLSLYLQGLAEGAEKPLLAFRQAHSGKYVLPPPVESPDEAAMVDRDFLNRLAAYSRGIPGIARTVWRASLRTRLDAETMPFCRACSSSSGVAKCVTKRLCPESGSG